MKLCRRCLLEKPFVEFHKNRSTRDGYAAYCKTCKSIKDKEWIAADPQRGENRKTRSKRWQENNPERYRKSIDRWNREHPDKKYLLDKKAHIWSRYQLTIEEYGLLLVKQNGACAICGGVGTRSLHVDHDHSCCNGSKSCGACIRGLLCFRCNTMLGNANDDINILQKAINYVKDFG